MNRPQGPLPCSATALYLTPPCHPPTFPTLSSRRQGVNSPASCSWGGNKTACPATNHSLGTPSQSCLPSQCQGQRCLYKEARKPSLNEKKQKGEESGGGFPGWNKRPSKSCHSSVPPLTSGTFSSVPTTTLTPLHCNVDRLKSSVLSPCWCAEG